MRLVTMTLILGLPLMALGQQAEPQQTQEQTKEPQTTAPAKEPQTTAPAKAKKMHPAKEQNKPQAKPETGTDVGGQTKVKGHATDVNKTQTGARSSTSQTNVNQSTKVNVQEFKSRHSDDDIQPRAGRSPIAARPAKTRWRISQPLSLPTELEAEEITVQVRSTESGAIDGIAVFTKSTAGTPLQLGNESKALFEYLKMQFAALKGATPGKLTIEMADELNYQNVIELVNESRRAGYEHVSPAPLNKQEAKP